MYHLLYCYNEEKFMGKVKIEGTVYKVGRVESYGAKGFQKRIIVVEESNGKYPELLPCEFTNDLVGQSESLSTGGAHCR
jgi:hypothetical protein